MDLFVCCLNKFPANFQKKRLIVSGWKISLSNFPSDPAGFSLLCNLHNKRTDFEFLAKDLMHSKL